MMGTLLTVNHEGARPNGETVTLRTATADSSGLLGRFLILNQAERFHYVFARKMVNRWLNHFFRQLLLAHEQRHHARYQFELRPEACNQLRELTFHLLHITNVAQSDGILRQEA